MAYELTSRTGAIVESHPDVQAIVQRLSAAFPGQVVTTDRIADYAGDPAHRVWVGDQLYGWAFPK